LRALPFALEKWNTRKWLYARFCRFPSADAPKSKPTLNCVSVEAKGAFAESIRGQVMMRNLLVHPTRCNSERVGYFSG
jgi:hypothetical protein